MTGAEEGVPDGPRGLDALVPVLAAEFPVYFFATQRTSCGVSLSGQDNNRAARPGVYAVITDDPDQMRLALRERTLTIDDWAGNQGGRLRLRLRYAILFS